ncbi:dimethyladenosine transferase [Desulfacinum infernum DSM 9756]|uniref:Ribosomal RNA small subunit methyltransferase A n=1 Tax=Desulfacinum infernum DSM 9756 TaxID=1121391 RepID=A0A1M5HQT4_9BACT|nr:16S rRNA (adenine(1518)-N(6)/adenine(1519)-N(6))-dimethyltransferase RsmA [Desulfacinum infernum]SHG18296.1 dimethyladenosine transferase [Desulfacinum infernum DSM 9756]
MDLFPSPHEYFRDQQGRPRKRLGQHFLAQPKTAEKIVEAAHVEPDDVVVEVGPGLGALTAFLVGRCARLHLVELDTDLASFLSDRLASHGHGIRVHSMDVLRFPWDACAREAGRPLVVVGNLPYNISSPLMFRLLENRSLIRRGVFMVQREVGERLAAGPGTKDYGVLSVLLSIYGSVEPLFSVGPKQFYPPPRVDSLVVRLRFHDREPDVPFQDIRAIVNAVFQKRRKTLANALMGAVPASGETLRRAILRAGLNPTDRPERIPPGSFLELARALREEG